LLHLGHARTFWTAHKRATDNKGVLVLRDEDLDPQRSKVEFTEAMLEDLRWLGIAWQEGPDVGGDYGPYRQSLRRNLYQEAWHELRSGRWIYPCTCSRKDLAESALAPHEAQADDEPLYPGTCRNNPVNAVTPKGVNWRFRVPDGRAIKFHDGGLGPQEYVAGKDFGDFMVWRRDDVPAYQLAVVVDDASMQITEVVRGADLLKSTARQLLLFEAFGIRPPEFFHCELMTDTHGVRLAKRHDALSLRALRESGMTPEEVRARFGNVKKEVDAR
jgi:glutamyl/glutaminyl-tRNA synthetase